MQELNNIIQPLLDSLDESFFENIGDVCKHALVDIKELLFEALRKQIKKLDNEVRKSNEYLLVRSNQKRTLNLRVGKFTYRRNQYRNKSTNETFCIDSLLGIKKYCRTPLSLRCYLADRYANLGSYQKTAKSLENITFSHQTIFNYLNGLNFNDMPKCCIPDKSPRLCRHIFIEADEDHINVYHDKRRFSNVYLIYFHEGYEKVSKGRYSLRLPMFFSGESPKQLWQNVSQYMLKHYPNLVSISIHGDGANWISKGCSYFKKIKNTFFIDKFHAKQAV